MNALKKTAFAFALSLGLMSCEDTKEPMPHATIDYSAAYVVNGMDNSVSVIDIATNQVSETIYLENAMAPHHIYLSPNKKLLAVAITSTDLSGGHAGHGHSHGGMTDYKVMVLDAVTGMVVKTIQLPRMPHNAVFNKDGSELWIGQSDSRDGKVVVYSTSDWALKHTIHVGSSPSEVTFSADGSTAFVANSGSATVTVINADTKAIKATLDVGEVPVGAWPGTDGKMYVDNEASETVSVIDVASAAVTETFELGFKPGYAAYRSGADELWVTDALKGTVVIFEHSGNTWMKKAEVATGRDAHAITFSANSKTAYVTNQLAHTVSVIDATTYTKLQDIPVGKMPNGILVR